jgi:hypothetical protein
VAIVLTKMDTCFNSPEAAKEALTDEVLKQEMMPMVNLLVQSRSVSSASIFPVSSYGFGNAEPHRTAVVEPDLDVDAACEEDHHWILRANAVVEPFNLPGLMIWSLLNSLSPFEINEKQKSDQVLIDLIQRLNEDFEYLDPWHVSLKNLFPRKQS